MYFRGLPGLVPAPATEGEEQRGYASGAGAGGARRTQRLQRRSWRGRGAPLLLHYLHVSKNVGMLMCVVPCALLCWDAQLTPAKEHLL